jgi:hypothetical protein
MNRQLENARNNSCLTVTVEGGRRRTGSSDQLTQDGALGRLPALNSTHTQSRLPWHLSGSECDDGFLCSHRRCGRGLC